MSASLAASDPDRETEQTEQPRARARASSRRRAAAVAGRGRGGRTHAAPAQAVLGAQTARSRTAVVRLEARRDALTLEAHARRALGARSTSLARKCERGH